MPHFVYFDRFEIDLDSSELRYRRIVHALRAIEIDNTLAETYAPLEIARQLDSNAPRVRMRYAVSELMPHGRLDVAIFELERALELDPFSMRAWKGIILVLSRRFEEALLKPTG